MTTLVIDRAVLERALEAMEWASDLNAVAQNHTPLHDAIDNLRAALAQQEQEPVAWIQSTHLQQAQREPSLCRVEPTQRLPDFVPLYTHPPRREWQGLTEEEVNDCIKYPGRSLFARDGTTSQRIARAIEAALKEKNQ
jgi:hypothetical protein